ncbi:Peptidase family S41 [Rhizoctonia solani]|uniref:Peptidase family S41 n=1 Tax=Rhizoctonia solani TaxID=456999 RepID=A0A8H7LFR2_9AGAM|nr:Peptidase family S41 [Rhizoctonia solani]
MYYLLASALSAAVLSSASPLESRQSDPCTKIVKQAWSKPSEVSSCLSFFPFNATLRDNVADVLSQTFSQFHTSTNFHLKMPDPFTDDTIDLLGEFQRIKKTTYKSDFELHRDISTTVKRLDDSLFSTYLPFPLAILARPGAEDVQNIHIVPEASEVVASEFGAEAIEIWKAALGGKNLTDFNGAQIISINGQDPWTVIDAYAETAGGFQAKTTRQNGFFASYDSWDYNLGGFAQKALPPSSDTVSLTLVRNGTTSQETYEIPYLSRLGSETVEFTDANSLWANNCLPTRKTNGGPVSNTVASSKMKTAAGAGPSSEEDPLREPAKFQRAPIIPPITEGRRETFANLVYDEPRDIALPEHLTPNGSVSGYGALSWYMLEDKKTAVLWLGSFDGRAIEVRKSILNGLKSVKEKGAERLLIDVTNNGGGLICTASFLHRVLAGPQPGLDVQPGLDGSVRAQDLPQKIVAKIVAGGLPEDDSSYYNPSNYKDVKGNQFAYNFNWLNPPISVQVNGISDKFSQKIGDTCLPFSQTPPDTQPFAFENIAIMSNGRCASACSLFSIMMRTKYNVKTVVMGGKPGTTQQYCGVVGGQSLSFVPLNVELKTLGLKNDTLAPPDFLTNSYQGINWKLVYSPLDPNSFEEFQSHPAQFSFPLFPNTVNNPQAIWKDVSKRLSNLKFAERWSNDTELRGGGNLHFMHHESAEPRRIDSYLSFAAIDSAERVPQVTNPNHTTNDSRFKHGESFRDPFSGDKAGEEFSHDAIVWKLYRSEAEEYDQELAALFSAILTAFLIEAKNMLQQDPADTTNALLLIIVQNQANGVAGLSSIDEPPFSASYAALWINGLWFAALGLSLSAALVAMLSKEWLTAYTASRPRPAHTHALLRQARFDGLNSWWALHIIALLPTLLHLSLLLFALGLVVYLWTLDVAVAVVTCAIVALTLIFYLTTTLLGAIVPFCPFVTEISRYLQQGFGIWFMKRPRLLHPENRSPDRQTATTSLEDIRAVSWLAENARDPVVVDCSYQALAGVCLSTEVMDSNEHNKDESKEWYKYLEPMFPELIGRFEASIRKSREMASTRGANLARFARATVQLCAFLDNSAHNTQPPNRKNGPKPRFRDGIRPRLESLAFSSSSEPPVIASRMEVALGALDGVWRDEHPPFSADSYASLTAAELRLVALNSAALCGRALPDTLGPSTLNIAIDMSLPSQKRLSILTLQNTYYRSLARASVQLRYHSDGRTPINSFALVNLLDALRIAAKCPDLNPQYSPDDATPDEGQVTEPRAGFSRPRSKNDRTSNFIIPVFNSENYIRPTALFHGPLGSIVRVLASAPLRPHGTEVISDRYATGLKIRLAAVRALAAVAPFVLQQWFREKISRSGNASAPQEPASIPDTSNWPDVDATITDSQKLEGTIASHLLLVVKVIGPYIERAGAMSLVELSLAELNRIANTSPFSAHLALRRRASVDFVPLLKFAAIDVKAADGRPLMNETTKSHILNLLTFEISGKNQVPRVPIAPESLPLLLRVAQDVPNHTDLVHAVLKYVVSRVRETKDNIGYLRVFTHSNQGYPLLLAIGRLHQANIEPLVGAILQIAYISAGNGVISLQDGVATGDLAIPGFLDAISLVVHHTHRVADKPNYRHLHSLGRSLVSTIQNIGDQSARMVLEHHALDELIDALRTQSDHSDSTLQSRNKAALNSEPKFVRNNEYLINQLLALKTRYLSDSVSSAAKQEIDQS